MRNDRIDYMKAVAIALVVLSHAISYYTDYIGQTGRGVLVTASVCYTVNVAVFFVLAGLLCRRQDIPGYYLKKVRAILVPFAVFSLLKIFYSLFISREHAHAASAGGMFYDAFVNGRLYWFVYAIFIMFLISPLLWGRARKYIVPVLLLSLIVINTVLYRTGNTDRILTFQINNVLLFLPFYLLGMMIGTYGAAKAADAVSAHRTKILAISAVLSAAVVLFYMSTDPVKLPRDLVYYLRFFPALPLIALIASACAFIPQGKKTLALMGKYSLQIMLFDSFYKMILYKILLLFMPQGGYLVFIVAVLDLALSFLTTVFISKIPVARRLIGL